MRGDVHAQFGGRAGGTEQPRGWYRAQARAYSPELQRPELVKPFLEREATPIALPALLRARSDAFVKDLRAFAEAHGAPWITFERGERKEDRMKPLFAAAEVRGVLGLVALGVAQERTSGWKGPSGCCPGSGPAPAPRDQRDVLRPLVSATP